MGFWQLQKLRLILRISFKKPFGGVNIIMFLILAKRVGTCSRKSKDKVNENVPREMKVVKNPFHTWEVTECFLVLGNYVKMKNLDFLF